MHIPKFPPMAGGSDGHQVICIEAKRICDFCFQEHRVDRTFPVTPPPVVPPGTRPVTSCRILEDDVVCRVVQRDPIEGSDKKVLACLVIEVPVEITVGDTVFTQRIVFLKQAVICAPEGTDIECQVTGNCCCFFDAPTGQVSCVFNFCVVIQSKVDVRVLVPIMGVCAPKECKSVFGCPPEAIEDVCDDCDDRGRKRHKDCD